MKKKFVENFYNLPTKVKFCKKCTVSNQRPRITFDKNGVCSACNFAKEKKKFDWKKNKLSMTQREKQINCLF